MRGKTVDRVPVGFYTHFPDRRGNTVAGRVAWTLACAMDYICIQTDGYMQYPSDTPPKTPADRSCIHLHKIQVRSTAPNASLKLISAFSQTLKNALPNFSDRAFCYFTTDPSF